MNNGIKQRLVGAVVLIALALILWPVVMSPQRDQSFVIESNIPEKPDFGPSEIEEPKPRVELSPVGEYQEKISTGKSVSRNPDPDVPALDQDGLPIAWIIQVGSFGNRNNAVKLRAALQADGYRAQIKDQKTTKKMLTRVIVGPYIDKQMARRDRNKIATKMNLKPEILRFKP